MAKSGRDESERGRVAHESIGLCATCRHHRTQTSARGSVFHRCERADLDDRFLRYPPIPVRRCSGHAQRGENAGDGEAR